MSDERRTRQSGTTAQFITFRIGGQEFCVDIMSVREIRGWTPTTPLPHAPDYVRGVINLRGAVLPIVDLRPGWAAGARRSQRAHVIIVVPCGERTVGLLVDAVSDILTATDGDIQRDAGPGPRRPERFVDGIAVLDERMMTVLDGAARQMLSPASSSSQAA